VLLHSCQRGSRLSKMQHGGHVQCTKTKGVTEKLNDETSPTAEFSGIEKKKLLRLTRIPSFAAAPCGQRFPCTQLRRLQCSKECVGNCESTEEAFYCPDFRVTTCALYLDLPASIRGLPN